MTRRMWLVLPLALPWMAAWMVVRAARMPLNFALLFSCVMLASLAGLDPPGWPGWRAMWGDLP